MVSLLRRKRHLPDSTPSTSQHRPSRELSHSLSLPDLTTPLLDPSSWEQIPDFVSSIPSLPNTKSANASGPRALFTSASQGSASRNRSPSLVGGAPGSPVAFHKPFGNWQVANPLAQGALGMAMEEPPVPALVYRGDFRKSTWLGNDSPPKGSFGVGARESQHVGAGAGRGQSRRRKKGRVAENLNVMLVGGKGVGKTSFLGLLHNTTPTNEASTSRKVPLLAPPPATDQTPSSPTSPGAPLTPSTPLQSPSSASSSPQTPFSPLLTVLPPLQRPAPTTRLGATTITLDRPAEKIQLCVIDTPGLDLRGDDGPAMHARQRERGVQALLSVAEERFGEVLREESKVVRRQLSGGSGLIHLCIYLIDARAVLYPAGEEEVEVDWSGLSLAESSKSPTEPANQMQDLCPSLAKVEVDIIRRLGDRMNVLPILTHADCLSTAELTAVRLAVKRDLGEGFRQVDGRGFGIFGSSIAEQGDSFGRKTPTPRVATFGETTSPTDLQSADARPLTPASTVRGHSIDTGSEEMDDGLPYAIFAPGTAEGGTREYPWGVADVNELLDLESLREAVLDTHAKALRMTTREVLYERYRTERLLARRGTRGAVSGAVGA